MSGAAPTPGDALQVLDVNAVRRWAVLIRAAFAAHRAEIDAMNVFPVPDGDTGTNLFLTVDGAVDRTLTESANAGAGDLLVIFAKNLLWSARGNSGVILSQLARGLAEECQGASVIDAAALARGLAGGDRRAWEAVTEPLEGTILSVSRAAAHAGEPMVGAGLHGVALAALEAGRVALEHTPEQLEVLARAGVVDAGGAGLVLLLECLERLCAGDDGRVVLRLASGPHAPHLRAGAPVSRLLDADPMATAEGARTPEYEVMYLLDAATEPAVDRLRSRLVELGDSVLVVGDAGRWNVHAHVDDVGAAIEAGLETGRPHQIRVTRLPGEPVAVTDGPLGESAPRATPGAPGIVACVSGAGLAEVFRAAGATVISYRPGRRVSTGQLIAAIRELGAAGADGVILLPNDADTELAARSAARTVAEEGITAHVVRSRAVVQGIAALAVFEPSTSAQENVLAMQAAASATRHGAIAVADRVALTSGGTCSPGDVLGIVDGDIVVIGSQLQAVAEDVARRLLSSGGELLTLVAGADAPPGLGDAVAEAVRRERRDVETSVIEGGQPIHPLFLGVE